MNINNVLKMAIDFDRQVKKASLRGNMAKRILFSLLSHLVPINESARIALTKGVVDYNALKQMIPGAKELIEYGTASAMEEAQYCDDKNAFNLVTNIYQQRDIKATLISLIKLFSNIATWESGFGGTNWARICQTLLSINEHLDAAEEAKNNKDLEGQIKELMEMTAYVNVLDGLAHNSGSIMEKMLSFETTKLREQEDAENTAQELKDPNFVYQNTLWGNRQDAEFKKLLRLMDSKELTNQDDILREILPSIDSESDASVTMRDWTQRARKRNTGYEGSEEDRDLKIEKIREKKKIVQNMEGYQWDDIKKFMQKLSMMADNKAKEEMIQHKYMFYKLSTVYLICAASVYISEETINKLRPEFYAAKELAASDINGDTEYKLFITEMPNQKMKSLIFKCYDLVFKLEKAVDEITNNV